jgi:hypothetical protein
MEIAQRVKLLTLTLPHLVDAHSNIAAERGTTDCKRRARARGKGSSHD